MKKPQNILDGPIGGAPDPETIGAAAQADAERAFDSSAGYAFRGEVLLPFSIERQAAAQRLGLKYGKLAAGEVERIPFDVDEPASPVAADSPGAGKKRAQRAAQRKEPGKTKRRRSYYINYSGMLDDCILTLFLCTLEKGDVIMIRGEDAIRDFWERAYEWAAERGIRYLGKVHGEAFALFSQIMMDVQATEVDVSAPPEMKRTPPQPGNSRARSA